MKKLYTLCAVILSSFAAMAQCTPDPSVTKPGLYPGVLPDAIVGTPYSQSCTLMVPLDTAIKYQGTTYNVRVDSASVVSMSDLPKGFSYVCNKTTRTWNGGERGCAKLMGDPVATDVGSYTVYVKVRTYFKIVGLPNQLDQLDSSTIDIKVVMPNALDEQMQLAGFKAYPNPAQNQLRLSLNRYQSDARFEVFNLMGQAFEVNTQLSGNTGEAILDISQLKPGVYIVKSNINGSSVQQKFIKE